MINVTCTEAKFIEKPHKFVERESETLSLIHNDLADLKSTPTRGEKCY